MKKTIAGNGQTPVAKLIAELNDGHLPSDSELADLMTALHAAVLDKPLMQWLDRSFEDAADSVTRAIACAELEEEQMEIEA